MLKIYSQIFDLLDRRERLRFLLLLSMILFMGLLDVAGVASILPFLTVLSDPKHIHESAVLSIAYHRLSFESDRAFLLFLGTVVFTLVVVGLAFKALTLYVLVRFSTMRNYSVSSRLLEGYLAQPYVWFLNRHSAELGKTMLSEVDHVIYASLIPAMNLVAHGTVLVALALLLFIVDPMIMAVAMGLMGASYALIFFGIRRWLKEVGERRVHANSERYRTASEALGGIKDVKILGLEQAYVNRFRKPARMYASAEAAASILGEVPRHMLEAVAFGGMLALVLVLLARGDGRLEDVIPVLGLFAFAGVRMFPAMQRVYHAFAYLQFGRFALGALHKDVCETTNKPLKSFDYCPMGLRYHLELDDIRYSYPHTNKPALHGLRFTIRANTTVGFVGGSGAGKTTLVDVILGLLTPQEGVVRVDGSEITDANRRAWQDSIGYVPQAIFLTDDTVTANIAFGVPPDQVDHVAVERAARIAELHQFVMQELPRGYGTDVGERGVRLSGGQRQRIGIARALYRDPDVLVFDEATSALDNVTERAVMDAVRNLSGAKTIIIVAHRLTTVEHCTEIMLLEGGQLSARGTYAELLNTSERFRQLVEIVA